MEWNYARIVCYAAILCVELVSERINCESSFTFRSLLHWSRLLSNIELSSILRLSVCLVWSPFVQTQECTQSFGSRLVLRHETRSLWFLSKVTTNDLKSNQSRPVEESSEIGTITHVLWNRVDHQSQTMDSNVTSSIVVQNFIVAERAASIRLSSCGAMM